MPHTYFQSIALALAVYTFAPLSARGQDSCTAQSTPVPNTRLELGAAFYSLIPNKLPGFQERLFGYGPQVGVSFGPVAVQAKGLYGDNNGMSLILADLDFRLNIRTPILTCHVLAGAHWLHYGTAASKLSHVGPNGGVGLTLNFDSRIAAHMAVKVYFQNENVVSMGAGILYII